MTRSAAIVIHNNCLLVMHRIKKQKEYYTFPGGTVEAGEDIQTAAVREVLEETSIAVKPLSLAYHLQVIDDQKIVTKDEYFFTCEYVSGVPMLAPDAVEHQRINEHNFYQPLWMPLNQVKDLCLYPFEVRDWLLLSNGR
jgi:8-oxo-dGTP diphosphatase